MGFLSAILSATLNSNFEPQQENGIRRDRIQLPIPIPLHGPKGALAG